MKIGIFDAVAMLSILAANGCFFSRKAILSKHGFPFSFTDYGEDHKRLAKIASETTDPNLAFRYRMINIGLIAFFVAAIVLFALSRLLIGK